MSHSERLLLSTGVPAPELWLVGRSPTVYRISRSTEGHSTVLSPSSLGERTGVPLAEIVAVAPIGVFRRVATGGPWHAPGSFPTENCGNPADPCPRRLPRPSLWPPRRNPREPPRREALGGVAQNNLHEVSNDSVLRYGV